MNQGTIQNSPVDQTESDFQSLHFSLSLLKQNGAHFQTKTGSLGLQMLCFHRSKVPVHCGCQVKPGCELQGGLRGTNSPN